MCKHAIARCIQLQELRYLTEWTDGCTCLFDRASVCIVEGRQRVFLVRRHQNIPENFDNFRSISENFGKLSV